MLIKCNFNVKSTGTSNIYTAFALKRNYCHVWCRYHIRTFELQRVQKQPPEVFLKNMFLKILQYSQGNTCVAIIFTKCCKSKACNLIKKKILTQVYSCEHFYEHRFWRTSANGCFCECPVVILQLEKHLFNKNNYMFLNVKKIQ